jgi:protein-S-isoprenylcysteine O-methyltransferase Ste14
MTKDTIISLINNLMMILIGLLFLLVILVVVRAIISGNKIMGRPPIPVVYFILAKLLVVVNLSFLVIRGLHGTVQKVIEPTVLSDAIALLFLLSGVLLLFLSTYKLNRDLIFGLSDSEHHQLQTGGVYAISRHPFYLGFILVLFSSCLFTPNYLNFAAFLGAWLIHHFIMVGEEKSLEARYGDQYRQYKDKVSRYVNLKFPL